MHRPIPEPSFAGVPACVTDDNPIESLSYSAIAPVSLPALTRVAVVAAPLFALVYALAALIVASSTAATGFTLLNSEAVLAVDRASAAEAAGLRAGDVIVAVNGVVTPTVVERGRALRGLEVGDPITLVVERAGERLALPTYTARRNVPVGSTLTTILGLALLLVALYAGRGRWPDHARAFLRSTVVYVVFLAGLYSLEVVLASPWLGPPWTAAIVLAAPVTCHFMMKYPAGLERLGRRRLALLYAAPVAVGAGLIAIQLSIIAGRPLAGHETLGVALGVAAGVLSAIYLTCGAVIRIRRVRRERASSRQSIDPEAIAWLKLNGVFVALPFCFGVVWAALDSEGFVAGGFKHLATVTVIGGSLTLLMAMMRIPFGQLDRYWRRSSGYVIAVFAMAAAYLGLLGLGVVGGGSPVSGAELRAAGFATIAAAIIFGPLRAQVQRFVDEHLGRDRARARRLLREASEAALTTLDAATLQTGVVHRVKAALKARGAAIYVAGAEGRWRREAWAGRSPLPRTLDEAAGRRLDRCVTAAAPRELDDRVVVVPLAITSDARAALVVAPAAGTRFDDEERDLLQAAAAGLAIAIGNARAHTALQEKSEELRCQVDVAEARRREIARLKERVEQENRALIGELAARRGRAPVIGSGLEPTFDLVSKVARTSASVLVRGETGVGKELVARAIHAASPRRDKPFIVVDCGALAPGLFESSLFGHVRGAFTGAVRDTLGAFRAADGGTIFLDEIGELPAELQPKLLRALQEREVHPVGETAPVSVDVRVISGTNRDLAAEVEAGNFREDLLYRLQVVEVAVPPLRQRRGDIEALAEHFLAAVAERAGRPRKRLAADAMQALCDHDWPGNVRELEHTIEAAAVYAEGEEIRAADLPILDKVFRKRGRRAISENGVTGEGGAPRSGLRETLEDLERTRLIEALEENSGNKSATARALGMSRGALLRRLKRYAIA